MTNADFKRIENELGLKLPAAYVKIMSDFPDELRNWPDAPGVNRSEWFFTDPQQVIDVNREFRKSPGDFVKKPEQYRQQWPANLFVFGRFEKNWHAVDVTQDDPPLVEIENGKVGKAGQELSFCFTWVKYKHATDWQKYKQQPKQPKKADKPAKAAAAPLSPDELIAEGRRLARPAVALHDTGKKYAAVWRGTGVASPGKGEWRHWISIDTSYLPDNPRKLKGVVSLYDWFADDDRWGELKVVHDAKATLPRKTDGTKLYAQKFDCLPDVEAVFQFGSKKVKDWAKATSWDANAGFNMSPVREYQAEVQSQHPFATNDGTYAMLGGWSWCFTWCYSIDEKYPWNLMKKALIVLTIAESEPWLEVFDDGKKFVTFSRIT